MKLSFVILNYKTADHLRICLRHIHDLNLSFEYEVIVVDNASHDGTVEMVEQLYPEVTLIRNAENVGHPTGNNAGLKLAQGEYILMINPDIIIKNATDIEKSLNYLDQHHDVALFGPKLHNPDGTVQNSCYRTYSNLTPIYRRTFLGKLPFAKNDMANHLMLDFDHNETIEVEWLLGACMFIRKKAMDEIGMMNEKLFLYFGDYEWCDRARQHRWKVVYFHEPTGIIHYHKRESATRRFSVQQLFSYVTRIHIKDWITYLRLKK